MNKYGLLNPYGMEYEAKWLIKEFKLNAKEKRQLKKWIKEGNSFYDNPWYMAQENGNPYSFIEALRLVKELRNDEHL